MIVLDASLIIDAILPKLARDMRRQRRLSKLFQNMATQFTFQESPELNFYQCSAENSGGRR